MSKQHNNKNPSIFLFWGLLGFGIVLLFVPRIFFFITEVIGGGAGWKKADIQTELLVYILVLPLMLYGTFKLLSNYKRLKSGEFDKSESSFQQAKRLGLTQEIVKKYILFMRVGILIGSVLLFAWLLIGGWLAIHLKPGLGLPAYVAVLMAIGLIFSTTWVVQGLASLKYGIFDGISSYFLLLPEINLRNPNQTRLWGLIPPYKLGVSRKSSLVQIFGGIAGSLLFTLGWVISFPVSG